MDFDASKEKMLVLTSAFTLCTIIKGVFIIYGQGRGEQEYFEGGSPIASLDLRGVTYFVPKFEGGPRICPKDKCCITNNSM